MDENKRCRVTCENQPARRRGSNKFAADSSLEEDGFERAVPPRRESLRGAAPGKHRRLGPEPVSASAFRAAVSDWQRPEEPSQERDRWFESGSLHRRVSNKPFRRWASMEPRTPQRAFRRSRTDGSNPVPSSKESATNLTGKIEPALARNRRFESVSLRHLPTQKENLAGGVAGDAPHVTAKFRAQHSA